MNRLELLQDLFNEVIVPTSVYQEVTQVDERPGARLIAQMKWLAIVSPQSKSNFEPLLLGLDIGETDVLLLAQEYQPDWVIIDERQARRVAQAIGLAVKGTLGILLAATLAGLLSKQDALADLQIIIDRGIRISPRLQEWFKQELAKS